MMNMTSRSAALHLLCFLAVLASSCRNHESQTGVVSRLEDHGLERPVRSVVFFEEISIARWVFDSQTEVDAWLPERIDTDFKLTPEGLYVRTTSNDPSITREVDIDADRVQAIRVAHSGLTSGAYMQFFWAAEGEAFNESNSLPLDHDDGTGTLTPTYTFHVGDHPGWKGRIARIRLDPTSDPNRRSVIPWISAVGFAASEHLLREASKAKWRVDFSGDVRTAVITPPGFSHRREFDVPVGATLRFAIGLPEGVTSPVTFLASVAGSAGSPNTLFEQTLQYNSTEESRGWVDHTLDLGPFAGERLMIDFETRTSEAYDFFDGFPVWGNIEIVAPTAESRPNLVLIVLDTVRADHLSLYGYPRATTPNLEAWARDRAVVFDNVVAPAPWTLPSHVSLFTGLDAISHGMNTGERIPASLTTLAERLRAAGYTNLAITGGGYLSADFALMQGFDTVRYYYEPVVDPTAGGNDIESGTRAAVNWLESNTDRPFFLFFHTYEAHSPYRVRQPYFDRFSGAEISTPDPGFRASTLPTPPQSASGYMVGSTFVISEDASTDPRPIEPADLHTLRLLYDSNIAFADQHVGEILSTLDRVGLADNTVVVITSDHGESLGERGLAGHASLYDWELKVPLMIADPSGSWRGRVDRQVRLIDVAPTILDLLHLPPADDADGESLTSLLAGVETDHPEIAWSYASSSNWGYSMRVGNATKYTYNNAPWPQLHGQTSLIDLIDDPGEEHDLAADSLVDDKLFKVLEERVRDTLPGLRIIISNGVPGAMHMAIKGRLVSPLTVKGFGLPLEDLKWKSQALSFTVPAGESATLYLEGLAFGEHLIAARLDTVSDGSTRFQHVLDLTEMDGPWRAGFSQSGWRLGIADEADAISRISVEIVGSGASAPGSTIDETTRAQLRELGYLE